jgi:hypothetical protein
MWKVTEQAARGLAGRTEPNLECRSKPEMKSGGTHASFRLLFFAQPKAVR